ncbi:ATP-binding cassette sub-family C member 5-like isoform X1 [Eriocheir sinensis]|uniref:ATP-binding cassette sub-family C member 5-like isoform X1 n=1 Tax=Eriocheir sinensis TaxID=95602 RepID=UPI0021CAB656|nr:ATP-binding cassette sub-family C member 5-like isoform X1 [Eriocheir sinensis]XP_050696668.1 ATP-binding cassette sub-family C member 5-like isoform X1 [Eriocheir sinensis]
MHNWGSSGSITLNHPAQPTPSPTPSRPAPAYRNNPSDAQTEEETRRLRQDESQDLDHIKVEDKETRCCQSKYSQALKHLLPCRPARKDKNLLPSNNAGFFSYLSVTWLTQLMIKAYRHGLDPGDMWKLQHEDGAEVNSTRMERLWEEEKDIMTKTKRKPELWRAVWRAMRTRVIVCMTISVIQNILQFFGPSIMLKLVLDYIAEPETDLLYASLITVGTFAINLSRGAAFNAMFVVGTHTATRITGAVQAMIYKKVLRLKTGGERLSAQIINFSNNDMERLFEACLSCVFITAMPVLFTMSVIYCLYILGPWSLLGQGVYILFYPLMAVIAKAQSSIRTETVKVTDKRVALMSEVLNSMRLIKMYSWEDSFSRKISDIRKEELKKHRVGALLQAVSSTITPSISILATIVTLMGYTLSGSPLKSSEAFTIFSVFNMMQFTIGVLPFTVRSIAEAKISMTRIQKLMELPEHHKDAGGQLNNNLALQIKDADFSWEVLNIDFKQKGSRASPTKSSSSDKLKNGDAKNGSKHTNGHVKSNHTNGNSNSPIKATTEDTNGNTTTSDITKSVDTLFNINVSIERGKLVGVCGSIGAGKSSLISALCGDMITKNGSMQVNGRLALVTQQAWIYNDTFRENLLVGQGYDAEKYRKVIRVCSLESDIELLANGDMTEIGERGINLSGGQKQRVNLGRAVYSDRDIYLLDDPLSAVDTKVARHIFNQCIKGHLADKTVILVTHAPHFLEKCDEIIVMQEGRIADRGTHAELIARKGEYFDMVGHEPSHSSQEEQDKEETKETDVKGETIMKKEAEKEGDQEKGKLITEETKATGSVSNEVYRTFIKVSGGWCITGIIFFAIIIFTLSRMFSAIWLQYWLDQGDGQIEERMMNISEYNLTLSEEEIKGSIVENPALWFYQLVYCLSFILLLITGVVKGIGVTFRVLAGASKLHNHMFISILRSPMSFFDTTPTGRILNRFSRDLDELDVRVPFFLEFLLQGLLFVAGQIILVCFIYVWFIIPLVFISVLFLVVDIFLNAGVRELKRLDNTLKSPITQHIGSSISGLSVIRTFDKEKLFTHRMYKYLDKHSAALLVFRLSNRWFTFRMDIISMMVTLAITAICVFTKGAVSTALAGLALSMINGVCAFTPFLMRMKSEFQSRVTSVERIIEYAYGLTSEAPREIPETCPAQPWPAHGTIELQEVKLRYRPDLPLVLHGISATINAGEKIGIVGRTGAGKSSLISTLLRMSELDSGRVVIDGVDVSVVGLHTLRSSISVIPQDPVLFQGSLRYNLDPFEAHTDEEVWQALEQSHLKPVVQRQQHGLSCKVEAGGENFSVGERQLICLTRALLRNSKILLLDEATASVDVETDHLIQATIREAFQASTVLTIAHRLNTVAHYDRILVLEAGKVQEFDTPASLMSKEGSLFREMLGAMGVTTVEQMLALT